ncbi:MAG: hypothetical protein ACREON_02205 [Gemmatimonadaceae bacterium]
MAHTIRNAFQVTGRIALAMVGASLLACGDDDPSGPEVCEGDSGTIAQLNPLQGIVVAADVLERCSTLPGAGANYLIVPQFATSGSATPVQYTIGSEAGAVASIAARVQGHEPELSRQAAFDRALRDWERGMRASPELSRRAAASVAATLPEPNSTRDFKVLASLGANPQFETSTASLRFVGTRILLYVAVDAPSSGFTDQEVVALGQLFDRDLFDLAIANFGTVSDIDANERVIVLLTPVVNRLTPASSCASQGFVTGFFTGFDLTNTGSSSNRAEIFYALVPDPSGQLSCAHSVAQIKSLVPATFIHELQHMISFNEHVLVRNGSAEELWLNEGLSHIAEEIASLYYERRFPAPQGRTNPQQIFPDSAGPFITGNLINSYRYLASTGSTSVTSVAGTGSLGERGATWLFLRWLGDHKGDAIFKRLVQTNQIGIANITAQAGEPFRALFGDFSIAVYTDSIPGTARTQVPERFRFESRNLRQLYQTLFNASQSGGQPSPSVPRPFPIELRTLPPDQQASDNMLPGTMEHFEIRSATASEIELVFRRAGGEPFAATLNAQVGVFRLP